MSIAFPAMRVKQLGALRIALGAYLPKRRKADYLGMVSKSDIGRVIDHLRINRDWSKKELAARAEIDPGNLNRIISGQQEATLERLESLSRAFSVRVSEIIRMAETGQREDHRKMALMRMVEDMPTSDLDTVFRRTSDAVAEPQPEPSKSKRSRSN